MPIRDNAIKSVRKLVTAEGSPSAFARKIGVTRQTVANWVNGSNAPDIEIVSTISDIYGISFDALLRGMPEYDVIDMDGNSVQHIDSGGFVEVPVYGSIAAGTPIEMLTIDELHEIPATMHERYQDAFLLRVKGESMNRVLPNGCFVLVDPQHEIESDSKPYAVCVNGFEATIKRVKRLENGFQLIPDSTDPTFTAQTFNYNEPGTDEITVIGKVVWHVIPFDWDY